MTAAVAHYNLVIRNAVIVDGTRAPRFQADVAVQNGVIERVGTVSNATSDHVIDGSGKILAPGFIDAHTHDDRLLLSGPGMAPKSEPGRNHGSGGQLWRIARARATRRGETSHPAARPDR